MKRLTYAAAIIFVLSTAGATFAQSPTRRPETGNTNSCMETDYNCNTQPKGIGIDNTKTTDSSDSNAARLRSELRTPTPLSSTGPEEPEQPIEPEAPISNVH